MTEREAALEAFNNTDLSRMIDGVFWHTWKRSWSAAIEWYKNQQEIPPLVFEKGTELYVDTFRQAFAKNTHFYYWKDGSTWKYTVDFISPFTPVNSEQECIDALNKKYRELFNASK